MLCALVAPARAGRASSTTARELYRAAARCTTSWASRSTPRWSRWTRRRSRCSPRTRPPPSASSARDFETLTALGDKSYLPTTAALLAQALHELGRDDEALHFTEVSEEKSFPDDLNSEVEWRCARARILRRRALRRGGAAGARSGGTGKQSDFLEVQGNATRDLAETLAAAGRVSEASAAAHEALGLTRLKEAAAASSEVLRRCASLGIPLGAGS